MYKAWGVDKQSARHAVMSEMHDTGHMPHLRNRVAEQVEQACGIDFMTTSAFTVYVVSPHRPIYLVSPATHAGVKPQQHVVAMWEVHHIATA